MNREQDLAQRINRLKKDVLDVKNAQTIGGDGWIVYRKRGTFTANIGTVYRVDFTPTSGGKFTAVLWQGNVGDSFGGDLSWFYPDPNIPGRWYMTQRFFGSGTIDIQYMLYATKKGNITITPV
jgi:hypothetical protein